MTHYALQTPEQVSQALAAKARERRLARGWKQTTLAQRSGVSLGSLRRFESSGLVSLQNLLKIAFALNRLGDFDPLFEGPRATSIAELEAEREKARRQRGRQ
jgi:HTH-type transcriptional regulator/antitoxin HipB